MNRLPACKVFGLYHLSTLQRKIHRLQNISENTQPNSHSRSQQMIQRTATLFVLLFCLTSVNSADEGDWVDTFDLPIGFIAHPFYAGYLNLTQTQAYYYTYFPSENNPLRDPLIFRISAGPGCSALYSNFYSKGPFTFVKGTKNFTVNLNNWNKEANVVFIEGPAGVGFSTGTDKQYSDERMAVEFFFAIERFYEKFPELKAASVYLTGEQYAGITIPRMADLIIELNQNPNTPQWERINLKGLMLNNPCTLGEECASDFQFSPFSMHYLRNHYFISNEQYEKYEVQCAYPNDQCEQIKKQIETHFLTTGANIRNIYAECLHQEAQIKCLDLVGIEAFLNDEHVQEDMNVKTKEQEARKWQMCNFDIAKKFQRDPDGSYKVYKKLLQEERYPIKIWIISGTMDAQIPVIGTKRWIEQLKEELGLTMRRMWEPWFFNSTVNAGDIEELDKITLITVRSGGSHLWIDQPQIGEHIVESFVKGKTL